MSTMRQCPKCTQPNEIEREFCWVCYTKFSGTPIPVEEAPAPRAPVAKPVHAPAPATPSPAPAFTGVQPLPLNDSKWSGDWAIWMAVATLAISVVTSGIGRGLLLSTMAMVFCITTIAWISTRPRLHTFFKVIICIAATLGGVISFCGLAMYTCMGIFKGFR